MYEHAGDHLAQFCRSSINGGACRKYCDQVVNMVPICGIISAASARSINIEFTGWADFVEKVTIFTLRFELLR